MGFSQVLVKKGVAAERDDEAARLPSCGRTQSTKTWEEPSSGVIRLGVAPAVNLPLGRLAFWTLPT